MQRSKENPAFLLPRNILGCRPTNSQGEVRCVWLRINRDSEAKQEGPEWMIEMEGVKQRVGDDLLGKEFTVVWKKVVIRQGV